MHKELRRRRHELKLTSAQIGALIGMSAASVCRFENGADIPIPTALKYARALKWRGKEAEKFVDYSMRQSKTVVFSAASVKTIKSLKKFRRVLSKASPAQIEAFAAIVREI